MNSKLWIFVAFFSCVGLVAGHKYKSGECPQVEPMNGFEMKKVSESRETSGNDRLNLIQSTAANECVIVS